MYAPDGGLLELGTRKNMPVHGSVGLQYASVDQAKERGLAGGFRGLFNNIRVGLMEDFVEDGSAIESSHVSVEALEAVAPDGRCQGTSQHDNNELMKAGKKVDDFRCRWIYLDARSHHARLELPTA